VRVVSLNRCISVLVFVLEMLLSENVRQLTHTPLTNDVNYQHLRQKRFIVNNKLENYYYSQDGALAEFEI
jgi:hypothetical protein